MRPDIPLNSFKMSTVSVAIYSEAISSEDRKLRILDTSGYPHGLLVLPYPPTLIMMQELTIASAVPVRRNGVKLTCDSPFRSRRF